MNKDKAIILIVLFSFLTAIVFYCFGIWHADRINDRELEKFKKEIDLIIQQKEERYLGIISKYIVYTDMQESIIRELRTKDYIPPKSSPDIERVSREE